MLLRNVATSVRRGCGRVAPLAARAQVTWLQGRPPVVDVNAGTLASFYYKNVRDFDTPTKEHLVAVGQDEKFTVQQFDKQVYAYARGILEAFGVKKDTVLAAWVVGDVEALVLQYATSLLGCKLVLLDPKLGTEAALATANAEGAKVLFVSPRFGSEDRVAAVKKALAPELAPLAADAGYQPFASKRFRSLKYVVTTSTEFEDNIVRFKDLPVYGENGAYDTDEIAAVQAYVSKSDALTTYYSAGTAAAAAATKGRTVSHADALATAAAAAKSLGLTSADTVVVTAPVNSYFGFAAGALAAAGGSAKLILPAKTFDAAKALAAVTSLRATALVATAEQVPALAAELSADEAAPANKRKYNVSSLRTGLVGTEAGAAAPATTLAKVSLRSLA